MCAAAAQEGGLRNDYISEFSIELREFNDIFSNDQINVLPAFKQGDHAIKIENEKKFSYKSLYNLSQTKLSKFRHYFEDSL